MADVMTIDHLSEFLRVQLADCETHWSIGTFGALAEFTRSPQEVVEISRSGLSVVTDRGGVRFSPLSEMRLVASESVTRENWSHRVALCLRAVGAAMAGRNVLTELGPDSESLRARDREATLFDLGLGAQHIDACIRVSDRSIAADLRRHVGKNVFGVGNPTMSIVVPASPHRVFVSRAGRIEVFQPIPSPDGRSPEGPHTHVLPKLLQHKRTHPATEQIPEGFVPCAHLYPAHPTKDAFGRTVAFNQQRHVSFQEMLQRFGDRSAVELKDRVLAAIERGADPSVLAVPNERFARANVRIALRQLRASRELSPALEAWLQAYDRPHANPAEVDGVEIELHA
jgi:hypothetical protein